MHSGAPRPAPTGTSGSSRPRPSTPGAGWPVRCCVAGLDRAGADGVPAVLETTNPGNLGLYEHLGWQAHASTTVGAMTVWVLTHSS